MLETLQRQFEIPGIVRIEPGNGGLTRLVITSPQAAAEIYLHGAHVTRFEPAGQRPVLWMSRRSWFEPGKPIRGGVPICFPWFGPKPNDPAAPTHGLVRLRQWTIESVRHDSAAGAVIATLSFRSDASTRAFWPGDFLIRHIVTVGPSLQMRLEVTNTSTQSIRFDEALHTYLAVGDIREVFVEGLGGTTYLDKAGGQSTQRQQIDPQIRFTGETDRVYFDTQATCVVHDPQFRRRIQIEKSGSNATVVWNPWIAKARSMPDFGDDEWPGMVCVETVNALKHAVELQPGQTHAMAARVTVLP